MGNSETSHKARSRPALSRISIMHYFKLVFRTLLFLGAVVDYVQYRFMSGSLPYISQPHPVMWVIWFVFALEMTLRFFPGRLESMGCQKQFSRNYRPTGKGLPAGGNDHSRMWIALAWFALNGAIGAIYFAGWIDKGILVLISLAYSVCDMICILFFCPFQTWFMKNKCCGSCRIYNWDYAMMFTPLLFVGGFWAWSLLALSLGLLFRWEYTYKLHPERFYEHSNLSLACANCREKLCHHKKKLRSFLRKKAQRI